MFADHADAGASLSSLANRWDTIRGVPSQKDCVERIVTRLEAQPATVDIALRSPVAGGIPDEPGIYLWWAMAEAVPHASGRRHPTEGALRAFYVGISPARRGTRQRLRGRVIGNHIRGNTAASTFRFALAALLRETRGYQACLSIDARGRRKYVLPREQDEDLRAWQQAYLRLTWATCEHPWELEEAIIARFQPPLNSADNAAHPFSSTLAEARRRYREAATACPESNGPPPVIRRRIDEFLRTRPQLATQSGADNQCRIATDALIEKLASYGIDARATWVRGHRREPRRPSARAMAASRHRVVRLAGGAFVDVTRRQFDHLAEHPTYYAFEAELANDWREINRGPADGTREDEDWRRIP